MSYLIVDCPWCGERYDFGVVGTQMIGSGHRCQAVVDCLVEGCPKRGTFHIDDGSRHGVMVCGDHIEDRPIMACQPGVDLDD